MMKMIANIRTTIVTHYYLTSVFYVKEKQRNCYIIIRNPIFVDTIHCLEAFAGRIDILIPKETVRVCKSHFGWLC